MVLQTQRRADWGRCPDDAHQLSHGLEDGESKGVLLEDRFLSS